MSDGRAAAGSGARRVGSGAGRLIRAWRVMPPERRLAAYAAVGLFFTLFLPWYQREFFVVIGGKLQPASDSQTAWGAFSFVEAAVLLVAAGVLTLLFQRAEGKAFHLPGGDGLVVTIAGCWTCALIVWRIFDKQGGTSQLQHATTYGIEWGIFVALAVAALLAYAGSRIRAAHRPEPPLPGEDESPGGGTPLPSSWPSPEPEPVAPRPRAAGWDERQPPPRRRPQSLRSDPPPKRPDTTRRPDEDAPWERPGSGWDRQDAPPHGPDAGSSRERRVGWLTAPPSHLEQEDVEPAPRDWPAPEWPPSGASRQNPDASRPSSGAGRPSSGAGRPSSGAGRPSSGAAGRGSPPPKPVPAEDPPTIRASRNPAAPLPPSTPAARRNQQSDDDQLTIPIDRDD